MEQYSGSKNSTFIVRIWLERSEIHPRWRGQIQHIQSGEKAAFMNLKEMGQFIQSLVSMPDEDNCLKKVEITGNKTI